ncbi:MAG: HDIG domain-containing protein [Chloroflexota bacterium]
MPVSRSARPRPVDVPRQQAVRAVAFAFLIALAVWALLSVNLLPRAFEVREGDVSQATIRSPRKLTYTSTVKTKAERDRAAAAVAEVIEIDPSIVKRQRTDLTGLLQGISAARTANGLTPDQREAQIARLGQPPFETPAVRLLANMDDARWYLVSSESQRLLADAMKDRVPASYVTELNRSLTVRAGEQLTDTERSLAVDLTRRFVVTNMVPNPDQTSRLRKEAADSVAPVQVTVEKGEIVVREGEVIGPSDLERLELLGLRNPTVDWRQIGAAALFAFVSVALVASYLGAFQPGLVGRDRALALLGLLIVVTVLAAKGIIPTRPLWVYVFPLPAVAMLVATLLDGRLAIVLTAALSLLVGFVAGVSFEVAAMGMVTGVVAAVYVWRRDRLQSYFVAGLLVALAQIAVILAFQLVQRDDDWQLLLYLVGAALINGFISATLTVGTVSLLGRIFGITTTIQLLELANPTQPLLRRLLMEAPGTYHHSIMVGNLGERAAEEVGADPLLVRVGAYYHDIGKLKRPYFFVENQAGGENVHETLSPEVSADIIRAHVKDGVELCEQYGLPPRVRELIPQHHGTRLVSFFFHQAEDAAVERGAIPPDPARFKYPGPRPQTKEGAILMLADTVEAAARASKDHSAEAITALVEQLVMQRVAEGQLDDCDLTLRDVQRIKDAFRAILVGMYHPRIEYPERAKEPIAASRAPELAATAVDAGS